MFELSHMMNKTLMVIACLSFSPLTQAAISLDRTRAIFNGGERSMTLNIANDNKQLPYLAQAWLENDKQEKITTGPLIATPPVQRLEPGAKSMVRIASTAEISNLPQDRESLFYFNLREIPPRSDKANVLQIALQTKIKLFYRPQSIATQPNAIWQDQLVLNKVSGGYLIDNPSPYYVTVIGLGANAKQAQDGEFEAVMLAPKSSRTVKSGSYATPYLSYINDYGGRPVLQFVCAGDRCSALKK
ncbi:fimbria/pilus periplasmic chaperone [Edwardsiella piscicida]|uniref:fimbrial biogenesis chaperone n=1 Tax=Edwardsiella piscicida TaxID=1263550 RepID=UPI00093300D0|nr:fimbria/pilus periplasmic chaperone [Edwardsiella piscicida]EKS7813057.1 fimbria/pilus periplasmic chaperone [Edwardsiella piscicida]ELM3723956.1 fimbria/pilus periplasmic chaperone [Edwardsiella piscicida]UCQ19970.1 fimbria/pilus periplasmic chaperone [Edwardsiella piscicida]WAM43468.1 fimbria/pilus periplasmic chaperone [Edwardsiella piscicida]